METLLTFNHDFSEYLRTRPTITSTQQQPVCCNKRGACDFRAQSVTRTRRRTHARERRVVLDEARNAARWILREPRGEPERPRRGTGGAHLASSGDRGPATWWRLADSSDVVPVAVSVARATSDGPMAGVGDAATDFGAPPRPTSGDPGPRDPGSSVARAESDVSPPARDPAPASFARESERPTSSRLARVTTLPASAITTPAALRDILSRRVRADPRGFHLDAFPPEALAGLPLSFVLTLMPDGFAISKPRDFLRSAGTPTPLPPRPRARSRPSSPLRSIQRLPPPFDRRGATSPRTPRRRAPRVRRGRRARRSARLSRTRRGRRESHAESVRRRPPPNLGDHRRGCRRDRRAARRDGARHGRRVRRRRANRGIARRRQTRPSTRRRGRVSSGDDRAAVPGPRPGGGDGA